MKYKRTLIILVFASFFFYSNINICSPITTTNEDLRDTPIVKAVKKAKPAVVNISTQYKVVEDNNPFIDPFFRNLFGNHFSEPQYRVHESTSLGSGVIISKEGYILTNDHVVMDATKITVTLADKREFEGKIEGGDPDFDIAIVKIDPKGELPFVEIGDSKTLMIGEPVIAIGNPFGYSHTVTSGIVSALDRSINIGEKGSEKIMSHLIQTDTAINPGNSGGPLLNIYGRLIGITSAIQGNAEGINFAIPIDIAVRIIKDLLKYGEVEPPWIGLFVQEVTQQIAYKLNLPDSIIGNVIVIDVLPDSPAEKANIQRKDIINEVDGKTITSENEYLSLVNNHAPNDNVEFTITRNDKKSKVTLKTTNLPLAIASKLSKDWLGFEVTENSSTIQSKYKLAIPQGVVITNVLYDKPAYNHGLRPGDIIIKIDSKDIKSMKDFEKSFVASSVKNKIYFQVVRGNRAYSLYLPY
jgi:serine protease Do